MLRTARLVLRDLNESHREAFAALHADAQVMADLGGPVTRAASDAKFDRYRAAQQRHGVARMAVETPEGDFLGYCGVMPVLADDHPLGVHHEIGWRFAHSVWGQGFATESARAILDALWRSEGAEGDFPVIHAYTSPQNLRSQAVMHRLGLQRRPALDFDWPWAPDRGQRVLVWTGVAEL